jgi:hypothetical protein
MSHKFCIDAARQTGSRLDPIERLIERETLSIMVSPKRALFDRWAFDPERRTKMRIRLFAVALSLLTAGRAKEEKDEAAGPPS